MSVLLIKTDPIYFYLNNDTKYFPQRNKFVIVDIIQNEWHKLVVSKIPHYISDSNTKFNIEKHVFFQIW